jgi:hypothetical protein
MGNEIDRLYTKVVLIIWFAWFVIVVLLLSLSSCSAVDHLSMNPCTSGYYQNCDECAKWREAYPREWKAYVKRIHNKDNYCRP